MAIPLTEIHALLLPGLLAVSEPLPPLWFVKMGQPFAPALATPHIWIPKPLPLIVAGAAAAAIVKNPVVSRRFWSGWFKDV